MSYAEIQRVTPDVFDPAGGDVANIFGRNLTGTTAVRAGLAAATNLKSIANVPQFDAVNDILNLPVPIGSVYSATAYSGWALVCIEGSSTNSATIYDNDSILATQPSAFWNLVVRSNGTVGMRHFDGTAPEVYVPIPFGRLALIQWTFDGVAIYLRVNGGTRVTIAATTAGWVGTETMVVGTDIGGTHFLNGRVAEIGLTDITLSNGDENNVVAYVNNRYGTTFGGIAASGYDPAALTLTLWTRSGDYVSGTWTGTASAGTSGANDLTEATNPPAVAETMLVCTMPAPSGYSRLTRDAFPSFDGTNDTLGNAAPITDFVSAGAGSIGCFFFARSAFTAAGSTTYYADPGLFMNDVNGYLAMTFTTAGVRLGSYDTTSSTFDSVAIPCSVGEWHYAQARWNGSTLEVRVDGGDWALINKPVTLNSDPLIVGCGYSGGNYFDGKITDLMSEAVYWSNAEADDLVAYINTRYGKTFNAAAGDPAFSPATRSLTLWTRAGDYVSGTWTATASAGTSGTHDLTEATNPPAVSAPLLGYAAPAGSWVANFPEFNGVDTSLASTVQQQYYLGTTAWSYTALVSFDGLTATAQKLWTDTGEYTYLYVDDTACSLTQYDTGGFVATTVTVTMDMRGEHVIQARWTGTDLELRVDGGEWATTACTQIGNPAGTLVVGRNYASAANTFLDGRIKEQMFADDLALTDAEFTDIVGYMNARYHTTFGGIRPSSFDPATLALSMWHRAGDYQVAFKQWTGLASFGTSGGRNLATGGTAPTNARAYLKRIVAPLTVKNASGSTCLSDAIEYANPGMVEACAWWLRPEADAVTLNTGDVDDWTDQSPLGHDIIGSVAASTDPLPWNATDADYGGKPTVGPFIDTTTKTLAWVRPVTPVYGLGVIGDGTNGGNAYFTYESGTQYNALVNGSGTVIAYANVATDSISAGGADELGRYRSLAFATYGAAGVLYADGAEPVTGDLTAVGGANTLGGGGVAIGTYAGTAVFAVRRIAEVFAFDRPISLRDVRTLRRYRDSYYGPVP